MPSHNITYLGGVFLPLCVLMRHADLCGVKIHKGIIAALMTGSIAVFGIVFSTGYSDLYYKNVSIKKVYGAVQMVKEYGRAHNTYKILLVVYVIALTAVMVKAFRDKNRIPKKTVFSMMAVILGPCVVYLSERLLGVPIELLPFSYTIVLGLYLNIINKLKMFDMTSSIAGAYEKQEEYGYITFDLKKNFMSCNKMAYNMFPELENVEIDETAENKESVLYNEIIKWLELGEDEEQKKKKINVGDRDIICKLRRIYAVLRRKFISFLITIMLICQSR